MGVKVFDHMFGCQCLLGCLYQILSGDDVIYYLDSFCELSSSHIHNTGRVSGGTGLIFLNKLKSKSKLGMAVPVKKKH
jgi:hypothetical protein